MSGYEFDPKDKDGSLRDRFDCYCKEVIGRAAHNLVFKQAQYLICHSHKVHKPKSGVAAAGVTYVPFGLTSPALGITTVTVALNFEN